MGESGEEKREHWSAAQQAVWEREETYWDLVEAGNLERYLELWDDDFVGWPFDTETPITRSSLRTYERDWFEKLNAGEFRYTLTPQAIAVAGDVAIAYYRAHLNYIDDHEEETMNVRVTHTWLHDDEEWKILGGMNTPTPED